jgi:hypothetical protein
MVEMLQMVALMENPMADPKGDLENIWLDVKKTTILIKRKKPYY